MKVDFGSNTYDIQWWSGENLGSTVAIDTETTVKPFYMVPELVTTQAYGSGDNVYYVKQSDLPAFFSLHKNSNLVMHNAAFDVRVIEVNAGVDFSPWYASDRIWDTGILYRLLHLAVIGHVPFKYSLALLTEKFLHLELEKEDSPRLDFGRFLNQEIPAEHLVYGAKDVIATRLVYDRLCSEIDKTASTTRLSHTVQIMGDYALKRIHENGIGFDLESRDIWLKDKNTSLTTYANRLAAWGWVRGKKGLQYYYEQAVTRLGFGHLLPKTATGDISSASEDLLPYRSYQFVDDLLNYSELEKATSFVRDITSNKIHPRYNLLVNTGRTSCSKPNFQQLPRLGGIREMFVAEPGKTFIVTDYSTLELATLSQVLLDMYGHSVMAEKINAGADLHKYYASILYGKEESEVTKDERQSAKAANFGFPGGLGIETFIEFSRGYGLELSVSEAERMRATWFQAFPEMIDYLSGNIGKVMTLTGRIRENTTFCAEKNTPFQGLAADGAKLALYDLTKAGFKIVGYVHDEIITEVDEKDSEKLLAIQEKIMIESMKKVVPDVNISVESQVSRCYTK